MGNLKPVYHRELFDFKEGKRIPKTSYSLEKVWEYFHICYLGVTHGLTSANEVTDEQLELNEKKLRALVPDITPDEEKYLSKMIEKYGVETILIACDLSSYKPGDLNPDIHDLSKHINDARGYINRMSLRSELG